MPGDYIFHEISVVLFLYEIGHRASLFFNTGVSTPGIHEIKFISLKYIFKIFIEAKEKYFPHFRRVFNFIEILGTIAMEFFYFYVALLKIVC